MIIFNKDRTEMLEECEADLEFGRLEFTNEFLDDDMWNDEKRIVLYVPYTEAELKKRADDRRHAELKAELEKVKEDIEQEIFGLLRDDYAEKKARAAEIVNELRILEGKEPRELQNTIL